MRISIGGVKEVVLRQKDGTIAPPDSARLTRALDEIGNGLRQSPVQVSQLQDHLDGFEQAMTELREPMTDLREAGGLLKPDANAPQIVIVIGADCNGKLRKA